MSKILLISIFASFTITNCFAQSNPSRIYGTVVMDKSSSVKQTEVTVEEWMGFIACNNFDKSLFPDQLLLTPFLRIMFEDLKQQTNFKYLELVQNKEYHISVFGEKSIKLSHKVKPLKVQYGNFLSLIVPVTGISFMQVKRFCNWKEEVINKGLRRNYKLKVSLPTIELYVNLIRNTDSLCNRRKCDSCKMYRFNYSIPKSIILNCDELYSRQGQELLRVDAYWPNDLQLYNLQGNASEMTSTEGIAMGGSFRHFARQSFSDEHQKYEKSEAWLGFRYIITTY